MMNENVENTICEIAREVFRQPSLIYNSTFVFRTIVGFDSVLAIHYILAIEKEFGITLTEDEVDKMNTMGDLVAILRIKKNIRG